jgi:hypothetical protein
MSKKKSRRQLIQEKKKEAKGVDHFKFVMGHIGFGFFVATILILIAFVFSIDFNIFLHYSYFGWLFFIGFEIFERYVSIKGWNETVFNWLVTDIILAILIYEVTLRAGGYLIFGAV